MYGIEIKIGDRIINNDELKWHTHKGEGYLTLQEIYEQIKAKGYDGVIYVWEEQPLEGTIYMCENYGEGEGEWVEHGTTRGYA